MFAFKHISKRIAINMNRTVLKTSIPLYKFISYVSVNNWEILVKLGSIDSLTTVWCGAEMDYIGPHFPPNPVESNYEFSSLSSILYFIYQSIW